MISSSLRDKDDEVKLEKVYNFALSHMNVKLVSNDIVLRMMDGEDFFPKEMEDNFNSIMQRAFKGELF
jgi:hypothetical protein